MSENKRTSQQIIDELIKISSEEKEEKEAKIIELKKDIDNKYYGMKKPLIIEAKNALLKEGIQKERVTAEIVRKLEGYITEVYIRRCIDDPELKDQSKVRKQIELTNTGEQVSSEEASDDTSRDKEDYRAEYEKNKYYKNMPPIQNNTLPANSMMNQSQNSDNPQENNYLKIIAQLKQKIETIESERSIHTTVLIDKRLFPDVLKFVEDKKIKRIYIDFDENMAATKVRAEI